MGAVGQSVEQFWGWFLANVGTISAIVGVAYALVAILVWFHKRFSARRKLDQKGWEYNTADFVHAACQGDKILYIVRWYLRAGIEREAQDHEGRTALTAAVSACQIGTVTLLVSRRFWRRGPTWMNPNSADRQGNSPLGIAVERRRRDIYDILVAAGAQPDANLRAVVLRQAVEDGDLSETHRRIRALQEGDIDLADPKHGTALFIAVERGHHEIVGTLLEASADPNCRHDDRTPLLVAAQRGLQRIAEQLLQSSRTDVDARGPIGETALILAAEGGHLGIVRALLLRNANPAAADRRGRTALMAAILGHFASVAELLREKTPAGEREAWLILGAESGDEMTVREWLDAGADPNVQAAGGRSALLDAARLGRTAVGRVLIESRRVNLDLADDAGQTALMLASKAGARDFMALLNAAGADTQARSDDGSTALMEATTSHHLGAVDDLLKAGLKPEEVDAARKDGVTPLMAAVEAGQRTIAERLLDAGANPNVKSEAGVSPLMIAITRNDRGMMDLLRTRGAILGESEGQLLVESRHGNLERVRQLLEAGISANVPGPHGSTPLLEAVHGGHLEVARKLIDRGADVHRVGGGRSALEWAVRGGNLAIVQLLLAHGANVNACGKGGRTPLMVACEKYHPAILDALLDANADVDAADDLGRTPLLIALVAERTDVETKLRARRATKGELEAQLILAARRGEIDEVRRILSNKPRIDTPGPGGETALLAASEQGNAEVVAMLLAAGADVNVKTTSGRTPLTTAAERGNLDVLDTLLAAGARADLTGPDDRTPLMIAAAHGHLEVVRHLLDQKNNPNEADRLRSTALMLAAEGGYTAIASELIDAAADLRARGPGGRTAIMFAAAEGHVETLELLIAHEADVNARDDDAATALILACLGGRLAAVQMLVEHGAALDARDNLGQSPLMIALLAEDEALEKALRDAGATLGENEATLIHAAGRGDVTTVRMLLSGDVDINARRRGDDPALLAAIRNGHSHIARMLLDRQADVNVKGRGGRTALIAASEHDDFALVRALTDHEARKTCEAMDENGQIAVLATKASNIQLHLKKTCGALLPSDPVFVTDQGRCYHKETCGSIHGGGKPEALMIAAADHLRPCATCFTNQ